MTRNGGSLSPADRLAITATRCASAAESAAVAAAALDATATVCPVPSSTSNMHSLFYIRQHVNRV